MSYTLEVVPGWTIDVDRTLERHAAQGCEVVRQQYIEHLITPVLGEVSVERQTLDAQAWGYLWAYAIIDDVQTLLRWAVS